MNIKKKKQNKTKQKVQHCWAALLAGLWAVLKKLEMDTLVAATAFSFYFEDDGIN